jgi:glucose uptake protein GlcU
MAIHAATALLSGPGTTGVAVAMGLGSAASFAASNALQHRAAGTVPSTVHRALAVLAHLARQPAWIVATCISFCALLLHALALRFGAIALVQPLMLVGVVLAVPVRSALERKAPRWCEIRAVGVTVVGLAVFILSANPHSSGAKPVIPAAGAFVLGCFVLGLCALRASRTRCAGAPARQAAMLGSGAGVMFGATAGLLKLVGMSISTDASDLPMLLGVLGALVAAGLLGTAMNQRAYQIAPISYSMPLVNVVDILVAVLFGAVVFGELPGHSATVLGMQLGALGCVIVGLRLISALHTDRPDASVTAAPVGQLR